MAELSHEPLSWLKLERYALGELAAEERRQVETRLALSPADRAVLAQIRGDESVLPPLPLVALGSPRRERKRIGWAAISATVAAAAAVTLALLRGPVSDFPSRRQVASGVKGGEVAIALYSERVGEEPVAFSQGERFKLLVTCPPWFLEALPEGLTVVMFQGGERFFPLGKAPSLACGNRVAWPGAFTLDGRADVQVCLTWSARAAHAERAEQLEPEVVCTTLKRR